MTNYRLALRVEGTRWVAYIAQVGTMERAVEIGSIALRAIDESPMLKEQFMELMKLVLEHFMETIAGASDISWPNPPQAAPEGERGGNA